MASPSWILNSLFCYLFRMRHIVLIAANGQLGTDLARTLTDVRLTGLTHADLDVTDDARVRKMLTDLRPDVVINTSAFHKVDICEDEPEASFAVNATAPYRLARLAAELDFTLVHFSSDYVFEGSTPTPRKEDDLAKPTSVYGVSKLAGENLVRSSCPRHFVIRSTGLYGLAGASGKGGNFVETMMRLGKSGNPVRVVNDQVMTPTANADLAVAVHDLLRHESEGKVEHGLYHVTSAGSCSWYEFAKTIYEISGLSVDLSPIKTSESGAKAKRPTYSVLAHDKWLSAGFPELRLWRDALTDYLKAKGHAS
jgi:dTDP-4-dehydrorhamnose reductase